MSCLQQSSQRTCSDVAGDENSLLRAGQKVRVASEAIFKGVLLSVLRGLHHFFRRRWTSLDLDLKGFVRWSRRPVKAWWE